MYVTSVAMQGLRCFAKASTRLVAPGARAAPASGDQVLPNVTLFLGDNGAGKTSVLRAIAMGAIGRALATSGFVPYSLVRRVGGRTVGAATIDCALELHAQDGLPLRPAVRKVRAHLESIAASSADPDFFVDAFEEGHELLPKRGLAMDSPAFFMVGYGATRRVETSRAAGDELARPKSRGARYQRVSGLFEEHVGLIPLSAWLPQFRRANPGRHKQVLGLLGRLLPDVTVIPPPGAHGEYLFVRGGTPLPLAALSDGYRAYIGWVADLLFHVCMTCPAGRKIVDNQGVVLVDEIDLHLHPGWQRQVLPTLSQVFSKLQFVVTSHSPLVAGSLGAGNIRILKKVESPKKPGFAFDIVDAGQDPYGKSADQILTSEMFGLESTRAPRFVEAVRREAAKAHKRDPEAALRVMRMLAGGEASARPLPRSLFDAPPRATRKGRPGGAGK